jgi:hypothetical protein
MASKSNIWQNALFFFGTAVVAAPVVSAGLVWSRNFELNVAAAAQ